MDTLTDLLRFVDYVLNIFIYALVAWAILSWLIAFNVVNMHNRFVRSLVVGLDGFFNPILRPIRRILPDMGGIDLSPMVLILLIMLVQNVVIPAIIRNFGVIA